MRCFSKPCEFDTNHLDYEPSRRQSYLFPPPEPFEARAIVGPRSSIGRSAWEENIPVKGVCVRREC